MGKQPFIRPNKTKVSDQSDIAALHAKMGFDYKMPDLDSPLFVAKEVIRDARGQVLGAAALKLEAEAYLWLDPSLPISVRYKVVHALAFRLAREAWRVGLDCVVAYLPPGLPSSFKKLLTKLGWTPSRPGWEPWGKEIK